MTEKQLQAVLNELEIEPVLTAHPTEAKRRAVLNQMSRLTQQWENPDEVLEALWQTEEIREQKIGPLHEVDTALYYFNRTIFETAANFYETFDAELAKNFPGVKRTRQFLTFASWAGGDRDGNPFVTPEISRTAMQTAARRGDGFLPARVRAVEQGNHARRCGRRFVRAAQSRADFGDVSALRNFSQPDWRAAAQVEPKASTTTRSSSRRWKKFAKVCSNKKPLRAANGRIRRLLIQAKTFGAHLAELDFRDHSGKLDNAEAELLEEFRAIREIQKEFGAQAASHFIVSMTRSADDILRLFKLCEARGRL